LRFMSAKKGINARPEITEMTDFRFFVPAELIKGGEGEGRRLVGGTISTEDWDLQKEKVLHKKNDKAALRAFLSEHQDELIR